MAYFPPVPGQAAGLGTLVAGGQSGAPNPQPMQTQMTEGQADEGSIAMLRQVEIQLGEIGQNLLQLTKAYPAAAEDGRQALDGLEQARQSLMGFLVSIASQMQTQQPPAPRYGAL